MIINAHNMISLSWFGIFETEIENDLGFLYLYFRPQVSLGVVQRWNRQG